MRNRTRQFRAMIAVAAFILFAVACNSDKSKEAGGSAAENNETPIEVTATQLMADYEADEATADKKYKGKTLLVSGAVLSVSKDGSDDGTGVPYVRLNAEKSSIGSVQFRFTAENIEAASTLVREQKTTIKGVCQGMDVVQVVLTGSTMGGPAATASASTSTPSVVNPSGPAEDEPNNKSALVEIRGISWIRKAFISDDNVFYIEVYDDGEEKKSWAKRICELLAEHESPIKHVRVISAGSVLERNADKSYGELLAQSKCN